MHRMVVSTIQMHRICHRRNVERMLRGHGVLGTGTRKIVGYRVRRFMVGLGYRRQVLEYPGPILPIRSVSCGLGAMGAACSAFLGCTSRGLHLGSTSSG
jgi:hypothetical protein